MIHLNSTEISRWRQFTLCILLTLGTQGAAPAQQTDGVRTGTLPLTWESGGPKCMEMQTRTPYVDYPEGTLWQPEEHELALSRGVLLEIQAGLEGMHGKPQRTAFRDFTLWPRGERSPDEEARVGAYKQQQRQQMWNQVP